MLKLKANKGYAFVSKDKKQVYGDLLYAPDNFNNYIQVTLEEYENIKKEIENTYNKG